jgi:hypothetical protein
MEAIWSVFREAFSDHVGGEQLSVSAMGVRAVFVFVAWLVIVRFADRRMLGQYSAFDTVLAVMIGSSRSSSGRSASRNSSRPRSRYSKRRSSFGSSRT